MNAITVKVLGNEMSLDEARALYAKLHKLFGEKPSVFSPHPPLYGPIPPWHPNLNRFTVGD